MARISVDTLLKISTRGCIQRRENADRPQSKPGRNSLCSNFKVRVAYSLRLPIASPYAGRFYRQTQRQRKLKIPLYIKRSLRYL